MLSLSEMFKILHPCGTPALSGLHVSPMKAGMLVLSLLQPPCLVMDLAQRRHARMTLWG